MKRQGPIQVYNREKGCLEVETVLGEGFIRLLYEEAWGRFLGEMVFKRRFFSKFYGFLQRSAFTRRKIRQVADALKIDLAEQEKPVDAFTSFNDFFTRTLKEGVRPVDTDVSKVISACDARLLVLPRVRPDDTVVLKGSRFTMAAMLGDRALANRFAEGTLLVYRLCPADYHRFHFPEEGIPGPTVTLNGPLHSVNPIALSSGLPILATNLRCRTVLETGDRAGDICMLEIGAMCVGSVLQTFPPGQRVQRGEEKGLFQFGGSTVAVLYEKDRVLLDPDITNRSLEEIETLVKVGASIGCYI